jgi:hypothetical protein
VDPREPGERQERNRRRRDQDEDYAERGTREPQGRDRARARERPPLPAARIARRAGDHVAEMTGKEPEGITSLEHTDDGGWLVGVEVVETRRIPDSTDILAVYEAELDPEGELLAYKRVKRYSRCQVGER